jgi:integrase
LSNYIENIIADEDEEYSGFRSIVKKIEAPPLEMTREKTVWTEAEVMGLLDMLVSQKQYEKACCVALAAFSGRRKSELMRYRVDFFTPENLIADGALYLTPKIKTKGRGSGKMLQTYILAKKFQPHLDMWMQERKEIGIESEWLFPNPADTSVSRKITALNSWCASFSRITGKPFYFHSLRHFFNSSLLEAGLPENVVTEILGWSSADMVRVYDDRSASGQIEKYFTGGEILSPDKVGLNGL